MHYLGVILAVIYIFSASVSAGNTCRAQNILDACLTMQQLQFKSCAFDSWQCKCHAQKKLLTCYDNCPDAESRTIQEMQVQVYCGTMNDKDVDRMTRAAKDDAENQASAAALQSSAAPASSQSQPPPQQPQPRPNRDDGGRDDQWMNGSGRKNKAQDGSNYSLLADSGAAAKSLGFGVAAIAAAMLAAA